MRRTKNGRLIPRSPGSCHLLACTFAIVWMVATAAPAAGQFVERQKLRPSDLSADDRMGTAVSVRHDTAVVSSFYDDCDAGLDCGSAYVYRFDGANWLREAKLTAPNPAEGNTFGTDVAVGTDIVMVGMARDDCNAGCDCGAAYVFGYDGTGWPLGAVLVAGDRAAGDWFGLSISLDGNTAVIGAPGKNCAAGNNCGAVYVFQFDGTSWTEKAQLTATNEEADAEIGRSVSLNGDTMVVGAEKADCGAGLDCGAAYVFRFDGANWVQEAKLTASDAAPYAQFGRAVSVSGNTTAVGAVGTPCSAGNSCGSVYVFHFDGVDWAEESILTASDASHIARFGTSASLSGSTLLVGASWADCAAGADCGTAYLFQYDGASWVEQARVTGADTDDHDYFAESVALDGDTAFIGAYRNQCATGTDCGAAYVFRNLSANVPAASVWGLMIFALVVLTAGVVTIRHRYCALGS